VISALSCDVSQGYVNVFTHRLWFLTCGCPILSDPDLQQELFKAGIQTGLRTKTPPSQELTMEVLKPLEGVACNTQARAGTPAHPGVASNAPAPPLELFQGTNVDTVLLERQIRT
jgi:hypothetical protein